MKRVSFIVPGIPYKCPGGLKVIFIYANQLTEMGYDVSVYFLTTNRLKRYHLPEALREWILRLFVKLFPMDNEFNHRIRKASVQEISDLTIRNGDYVFATASDTAVPVYNLSESKGKKSTLSRDMKPGGKCQRKICTRPIT